MIPGNPADSDLMINVKGRQEVGSAMAIGLAALDNIDLTNLKNWIDGGALKN